MCRQSSALICKCTCKWMEKAWYLVEMLKDKKEKVFVASLGQSRATRAKRVNYRTNKRRWDEKERRKGQGIRKGRQMRTSKELWYSLHPCWDDKRGLWFYSKTLLLPLHVFVLLIGIDERDQYKKRAYLPHSQIRQPGISLKHPESLRYASRQRAIRPRGLCRLLLDYSISCTENEWDVWQVYVEQIWLWFCSNKWAAVGNFGSDLHLTRIINKNVFFFLLYIAVRNKMRTLGSRINQLKQS